MASRIRKGDEVVVIAGKYKSKKGRVVGVLDNGRVRIEGVAIVKRHMKPGRDPRLQQGGIIDKLGTVHISNVMPLDPQSGKPTRVGMKILEDGKKVRVARKSGEVLPENKSAAG